MLFVIYIDESGIDVDEYMQNIPKSRHRQMS